MRTNSTGNASKVSLDRFRRLERAYLHLLASILPSLSSRRRAHIPGQLVILDSLGKTPKLRSVPPLCEQDESKSTRANQAIKDAVAEVRRGLGGGLVVNQASIKEAINILWRNLGPERGILRFLAQEKEHEIEGSFFNSVIVPQMLNAQRTSEGFYEAGPYIRSVNFTDGAVDEAFEALVSEAAICTHELTTIENVKPENIIPIFVPISALGIFRGVAVWFLLDADERQEVEADMKKKLTLGLANTLNAMYSNAVIDVFTAYWMGKLGDLTISGGSQFRRVADDAFYYLYPCKSFEIDGAGDSADEFCLEIQFSNNTVQKFLNFSKCHWQLIYPKELGCFFNWGDDAHTYTRVRSADTASKEYIGLVEAKLRDVALTATEFLNQEHWRILEVLGHHTGNLFKASGAINLINSYNRRQHVEGEAAVRSLKALMPIWGIASAISFIQKKDVGSQNGGAYKPGNIQHDTTLRVWLKEEAVHKPEAELGREVYDVIVNLVRYVYDSSSAGEPFLKWIVEPPAGIDSTVLIGEWGPADGRVGELKSLPYFNDVPGLFDKTSAITLGLFEMVRNIRAYPDRSVASGLDIAEELGLLQPAEKTVRVRCRIAGSEFELACEQPVLLREGHIPDSETLRKIRDVESTGFEGWVRTGRLLKHAKTSRSQIVVGSQAWCFNWQKILGEARRIYGQKGAGSRN